MIAGNGGHDFGRKYSFFAAFNLLDTLYGHGDIVVLFEKRMIEQIVLTENALQKDLVLYQQAGIACNDGQWHFGVGSVVERL